MKPRLIIILALALTQACKPGKKSAPAAPSKINKEYLGWDSAKINGNIPMISNFKDVVNKLGKPDSVVTPNYENISASYFDGNFKYCYFKGIQFEKKDDSLVFRSIDFRVFKGINLSSGKIEMSQATTIDDFKKVFPNSVENNELHGTSMDKNQWIRLYTTSDKSGDAWDFLFDRNTGKLLAIDYWLNDYN